ncbi:MAG: hypothetical protein KAI24_08930 [Planctomycetes bacterium]|nr:hypothetical protein [Planctomycetota bacterium]
MSKLNDLLRGAADAALEACWEQWRSLFGERVEVRPAPSAMVDPEALVLASLSLRTRERRLDDMLLVLAEDSHLLSVQRIKTLARWFPGRLKEDLAWFAGLARDAGDGRWRSLLGTEVREARGRPTKSMPSLSLRLPSAFMLRMRSGLGVGVKADLVACLAGLQSMTNRHAGGVSVAELHEVIGYSKAATRTALDEMTRVDVTLRDDRRPARYRLGSVFFQDLQAGMRSQVGMSAPPWGYGAQVLAMLIACAELHSDPALAVMPRVVQASRLHDLHDRFAYSLPWFGVEPVDPRIHPGEAFIDGFELVLRAVVDWADKRL